MGRDPGPLVGVVCLNEDDDDVPAARPGGRVTIYEVRRVLAVCALALLAGCGASHPDSSPSGVPAKYGSDFLSIVTPVDAAVSADGHLDAQAESVVQTARNQLGAMRWPSSAAGDIEGLIVDLGAINRDLLAGDSSAVVSDEASASDESAIVRRDLGLPADTTHRL